MSHLSFLSVPHWDVGIHLTIVTLPLLTDHPKNTFQASLLSLLVRLSTAKGTRKRKLLMIPFLSFSVFVNTMMSHFPSNYQVSAYVFSCMVSYTEVMEKPFPNVWRIRQWFGIISMNFYEGEIMPDQPDSFPWWDDWLGVWGKSSGCILSWLQ